MDSVKYHNKNYMLNNGVTFTAPSEVVNKIYKNGMFITTGNNGCSVTVHLKENNMYMGTLASFVKPGYSKYKDKNTKNITRGNLA